MMKSKETFRTTGLRIKPLIEILREVGGVTDEGNNTGVVDYAYHKTEDFMDLSDTENHDNRIMYMYTVHDKGSNDDSSTILAPNRAVSLRSFRAFIESLPSNVAPEEFRLDLIGVQICGYPLPIDRTTIQSGSEYQRPSPPAANGGA